MFATDNLKSEAYLIELCFLQRETHSTARIQKITISAKKLAKLFRYPLEMK
jgi:hypothetical protein